MVIYKHENSFVVYVRCLMMNKTCSFSSYLSFLIWHLRVWVSLQTSYVIMQLCISPLQKWTEQCPFFVKGHEGCVLMKKYFSHWWRFAGDQCICFDKYYAPGHVLKRFILKVLYNLSQMYSWNYILIIK